MPSEVISFQCIRAQASAFCTAREWQSFHTPVNLALALSGECGEISEIFQWKGPLTKGIDDFSIREKEHIGEEIADVMIYSTRLCDMCGIDLAYSVRYCASVTENIQYTELVPSEAFKSGCVSPKTNEEISHEWSTLSFSELDDLMPLGLQNTASPRAVALSIQSRCGRICELFLNKSEAQSVRNLPDWPRADVAELALIIGTICLLLSRLARMSNNTLNKCVSDKFMKNSAKYPVEMAKGSSAKYTVYADTIKQKGNKNTSLSGKKIAFPSIIIATMTAGIFAGIGYYFGVKGRIA